jgi:3-phenylpropionate/trans-cinnamate dioxygenase ferredoxin reductase subunit
MYLKDGRLIAADAVNSPREFVQSKALIAANTPVDREKLGDVNTEIKDLSV